MNNLEQLKKELIAQKSAIETKGGVVSVANTNPSPSEITAGINSISTFNAGNATALESDVLAGKTFYAGTLELKTGTFEDKWPQVKHLFLSSEEQSTSEDLVFTFEPANLKIRPYLFYGNKNKVEIYFNEDLETIGEYAFQDTTNFTFPNFHTLGKLTTLKAGAFKDSNQYALDLANLPESLITFENRCLGGMVRPNADIVLPPKLNTFPTYTFYPTTRTEVNSITFPQTCTMTDIGTYSLANLSFNCDLVLPPSVKQIMARMNYNGSFNNVYIPASVTLMQERCFYADATLPLSDIKLKTVTFEGVTPPSIKTLPFSNQAVTNGLKIYVPDESLEAYKSAIPAYLTSTIYPVSQKD